MLWKWDIYDFEDTNTYLSKIIEILGTSSFYSPRVLNFWTQNPHVLFLNMDTQYFLLIMHDKLHLYVTTDITSVDDENAHVCWEKMLPQQTSQTELRIHYSRILCWYDFPGFLRLSNVRRLFKYFLFILFRSQLRTSATLVQCNNIF